MSGRGQKRLATAVAGARKSSRQNPAGEQGAASAGAVSAASGAEADSPVRRPSSAARTSSSPSRSLGKLQAAQRPTQPKAPPRKDWREQLENIRRMRAKRDAPVDLMGCERLSDASAEPKVQRLQTLVSLMLSSQVRGVVVF